MKQRTLMIVALIGAFVSLHLAAPDATALQDAEKAAEQKEVRSIECKRQGFTIEVPTDWKATISERDRKFFAVRETNEQGQNRPAVYNFYFHTVGNRPPVEPVVPEAYAEQLKQQLIKDNPDFEIIRTEKAVKNGYRGAMVEFAYTYKDIPVQMVQYMLVHPDGKSYFIFNCGTTPKDWDRSLPTFNEIYRSVTLDPDA